MDENSKQKELLALDAIIAASLAGRNIDDVSDEELVDGIERSPELAAEAAAIIDGLGDAPFTKMINAPKGASQLADEPAGMYRLGSDETLDPALKAEIDRKREQIQKRLKADR